MQTFCGLTTDGMLDYLVAIYILGKDNRRVTTTGLAEKMHVSPAAVSSMLKRLEDSQHVDRSNADGILLTEQGHLAAMQLLRRHRLLEVFLMQFMGFTWDQVDVEAHRLEHAISAAFEDRMDRLCDYPTHCPHGDPIPTKDGRLPDENLLSLVKMAPRSRAVLRRIGTNDARVLRYLGQLNLMPGQMLELVEIAPFKGPVTVALLDPHDEPDNAHPAGGHQILGSELAEQLFVALL